MHLPSCLRYEALTGCYLTTLFGTTAEPIEVIAASPKKRGWMPVLTVLFLISYGLMTMLIMEQSQTIESQRTLIRELVSRQQRVIGSQDKTRGRTISSTRRPDSVIRTPVDPGISNPGSIETRPVFPGGTTASFAEAGGKIE